MTKNVMDIVECELDSLNTNLVVADLSKTEKTICLAVSPSLKQYYYSENRDKIIENNSINQSCW
ncbi:hypothetical protein [Thomasclavelia ramosa]|jgi:hypothetical protein|uniref:hypothetical protein n=1 Tax=Thomasclavelia ramosa TaxID=1547 RepID=UPI003450BA77